MLVAKGSDFLTVKMREIAVANNVLLLESPALARSIYYSTELEQEIPGGLIWPSPRYLPTSTRSASTAQARANVRIRSRMTFLFCRTCAAIPDRYACSSCRACEAAFEDEVLAWD
ncbi:hypothetical protein PS710_02200 [Pseudomonas fluorescens]|uniref:Uncharacterized protein n=1 Tax=Pseudomonas fluorescens TaxID=294 RepID=A0A5E7BSK4_PSEFL|nr:hypothetical protein PS710_02200 [Pseudomonas fluorescens]